jgi:hypothetical protein
MSTYMIEMTESVLDEVVGGTSRVQLSTLRMPNIQKNIGTIAVQSFKVTANTSCGSIGGLSGGITLANQQSNSYIHAPYAGNAFNSSI